MHSTQREQPPLTHENASLLPGKCSHQSSRCYHQAHEFARPYTLPQKAKKDDRRMERHSNRISKLHGGSGTSNASVGDPRAGFGEAQGSKQGKSDVPSMKYASKRRSFASDGFALIRVTCIGLEG
eukprot:scaffold311_cov173-Amphora_coffeaeformis.AAC.8